MATVNATFKRQHCRCLKRLSPWPDFGGGRLGDSLLALTFESASIILGQNMTSPEGIAPLNGEIDRVADMGAPTRIVMVRHGVTDLTTAGKLDGRGGPDPSLNSEGRRQAQAAAVGVRALIGDAAARVLTSVLLRTAAHGARPAGRLVRALPLGPRVPRRQCGHESLLAPGRAPRRRWSGQGRR